jgi:hypothetical protein
VVFISERKTSPFRKSYFLIFIIGILLLFTGFVLTAIANIIPEVEYGDPSYDAYTYLMTVFVSLANLFENIGIGLFSFATFFGALKDDSLSNDLKRALLIASGLGLIALVLFNIDIRLYSGWVF